jgi:two-component system LytT family response regulator
MTTIQKKYKAIIIDDEKMARTVLKGMLEEYFDQIEVQVACPDLKSGVAAIRKYSPDIVFLDIEMPGHSGLELLDFFSDEEVTFSIVFTTAYNNYAIQAFKLSAADYLLKPIEPEELERTMERYMRNTGKREYSLLKSNLAPDLPKRIALPTGNTIRFIEVDKILFMKAEGAYTHIVLKDSSTILVSKGLKNYEDMLSGNRKFFRCHKSYLVNLDEITEYVRSDGGYLIVAGKHEVSLSSERADELFTLINTPGK